MTCAIDVVLRLTQEMLGTIPKDEEVYKTYIESKKPGGGSDGVDIETVEQKGWTGFHRDENGLFVFDYMIKGFLKHWGNLKKDEIGVKALRSKLTDAVYVFPRRIYPTTPNGDHIDEPGGQIERPLRGMTPMGERITLVRSDFLPEGTQFSFRTHIEHTGKGEITPDIVKRLFGLGWLSGLGQFRNGGYGRFEVVSFAVVK